MIDHRSTLLVVQIGAARLVVSVPCCSNPEASPSGDYCMNCGRVRRSVVTESVVENCARVSW